MRALGVALVALCASATSMGAHAVDCTGLPEWNSATAYLGNTKVQETGKAYTSNWWSQGHSPAANSGQWQEWKLDGTCDGGNNPPIASFTMGITTITAGETVPVDASSSSDPDGDSITYSWNGGPFINVPKTSVVPGFFDNCQPIKATVFLTVKDSKGATASASKLITVLPNSNNPFCRSSSSVTTTSSSTPSSSTPSSISSGCTSPQYVAGTSYNVGQLVQNGGKEYVCNISGWCSSTAAWAYAPGTGSYWEQAWSFSKVCGVTSTSSSSSSVSSGSESSRSSVSSTSTSSGNLPKHAMVGYWHNFNNGSGLIRLADVDNTWDVIVIAFADDAGNGNVAFNLDSGLNKAQFIADVAAKRAAGKKVVLSFGGQNGTVTLLGSKQRLPYMK
jgi:chitodextrinase